MTFKIEFFLLLPPVVDMDIAIASPASEIDAVRREGSWPYVIFMTRQRGQQFSGRGPYLGDTAVVDRRGETITAGIDCVDKQIQGAVAGFELTEGMATGVPDLASTVHGPGRNAAIRQKSRCGGTTTCLQDGLELTVHRPDPGGVGSFGEN